MTCECKKAEEEKSMAKANDNLSGRSHHGEDPSKSNWPEPQSGPFGSDRRSSLSQLETRSWLDHTQEFGRLNPENLELALKHRENMQPAHLKIAPGARWVFVGPSDILKTQPAIGSFPTTGRINAVAFDPSNSGTFYVGASNGGVWKATNARTTSDPAWEPIADT